MPIVYKRADGGISICTPCVSTDDVPGFTMDQAHERAMQKDIPSDAINVFRIDDGVLPVGDVLRNAWIDVDEKGNVTHDAVIAKSVVDANLQAEMKAHMEEHSLVNNMGRDVSGIQAKIADCKARIAKLDAMPVVGNADAQILDSLKALIKGASN